MDAQTTGTTDVREMTDGEIRRLKRDSLAALVRAAGHQPDGTKAELVKLLIGLRRGGADRHVHGKTPCPMRCGGTCRVTHTDGELRYYRCDKCRYRFSRSVRA